MGSTILFETAKTKTTNYIDFNKVADSRRQLSLGLIRPAEEKIIMDIAPEHRAEAIKDINDINRIANYLLQKERYRDYMLFILGINFGLRISDLLTLRFTHLITDDFTFRTTFPIWEIKTRNTRKVKMNRYVSINNAVMDAVTIYLKHNDCKLDDFLFKSESNRGSNQNKAMTRMTADRIMKYIGKELHLSNRMATHSLRKTFAYHQMLMSNNDPRKLLLLQKILGHSSIAQTLDYIGITSEEIEEAYLSLNLGSQDHYLIDSQIGEEVLDPVS